MKKVEVEKYLWKGIQGKLFMKMPQENLLCKPIKN